MLKIHSIETMGALDGPGLRIIFFLQGCPLRCLYCHNPDTWQLDKGTIFADEEIVRKALRYKPYFQNNGGVTFSGGEPLLQANKLVDLLKTLKANGLHAAIDTSGYFNVSDVVIVELLQYTDLVILDIKHEESYQYKKITGHSIDRYLQFKEILINKANCKIWLKHVVVPGLTDDLRHMKNLEKEVRTFPLDRVEKFELLPYHTMGISKYETLGIDYPLSDTPEMNMEDINELKRLINLDCLI
ncbi:MAG: Pyruvate formate-lyase activating enzyme [Clostridiales bacterium 38_11]|nr:MAG: Pyruvate formate-lyase activating enzyme [Clostridiales bacterium 38_11]HBH11587.1 pyruvate formate lyase-activating protein [Clostridiales bacterium]